MALLDDAQMRSISPFFGTPFGRFAGKVLKKVLALDDFAETYEKSAENGALGPDFAYNVLKNTGADYMVSGYDTLKELAGGPFITISNHPYGGVDGLINGDMVGHLYPDYKLIVNKILGYLEAMGPSFIQVTPTGDERKVPTSDSISGIRVAMKHLNEGHPLGIFPSGAVSDLSLKSLRVRDRQWQEAIIKVIKKAKVPVVPIRFFDGNSLFFYMLGLIDWRVRILRLPKEVINKGGHTIRVAVGKVITVEEQMKYDDIKEFSDFLRSSVYDMPLPDNFVKRSELMI
ncbi:MAG: 1-acyl-sn-glycerol-3-phosphate acyltransferase [Bacteroidota bacterium]|nr:1-acyl-sn-glycerol-3-phosphate acyltransferase [Bacteroidota bacterium]